VSALRPAPQDTDLETIWSIDPDNDPVAPPRLWNHAPGHRPFLFEQKVIQEILSVEDDHCTAGSNWVF